MDVLSEVWIIARPDCCFKIPKIDIWNTKSLNPTLKTFPKTKVPPSSKNEVVIKFNAASHKLRIHNFVDLHLTTERDYLICVIREEYANVTIFVAYYKVFLLLLYLCTATTFKDLSVSISLLSLAVCKNA
jgi:hypothetical protein